MLENEDCLWDSDPCKSKNDIKMVSAMLERVLTIFSGRDELEGAASFLIENVVTIINKYKDDA